MKNILDKKSLININETYNITKNQLIWVHHPITYDLIKVIVKKANNSVAIVGVENNSPYFGQPDWKIKKTTIIGIV